MDARNELIAQLRAQLAERDGQMAAAHTILADWYEYQHDWGKLHLPQCNGLYCHERCIKERCEQFLANTAQAAAAHDERVRAEGWNETIRCAIAALSTAGKEET